MNPATTIVVGRTLLRFGVAPLVALLLGGIAGCEVQAPERDLPWLSVDFFRCEVQPVLIRECSAPACHGNQGRRMKVLAPGRMRMQAEFLAALQGQGQGEAAAGHQPPLTQAETEYNLVQARGMIRPYASADDSPLLNRPLSIGAGGNYHAPDGDVFASRLDPGYVAISRWIEGVEGAKCP